MAFVYQVIDTDLHTLGLFDDYEKANKVAHDFHAKSGAYYQVNRIPLNTIGDFTTSFDIVSSAGILDNGQ